MLKLSKHPIRTLRRRHNKKLSEKLITAHSTKVPRYPPGVTIELTNVCNLKCPLCPTGNGTQTRKPKSISYEEACYIIDELSPGCGILGLHSYGEPLLNKEFYRIVEYANNLDIYTYIDTNLNLIKTKEDAAKLINSGISEIKISLDGLCEETYRKYRVGGSFETVINATKWLLEIRNGSHYPKIFLQFLVMKHNEHELEDFKRFAKKLGVDDYYIYPIWFDLNAIDQSFYSDYLPENEEFSWYVKENGKLKLKSSEYTFCKHPFTQMLIYSNGDVGFCCLDFQSKLIIGNVFKEDVLSLWNSCKMDCLRNCLVNNIEKLETCRNCPACRKYVTNMVG